jgi:hypothetical protein
MKMKRIPLLIPRGYYARGGFAIALVRRVVRRLEGACRAGLALALIFINDVSKNESFPLLLNIKQQGRRRSSSSCRAISTRFRPPGQF